MALCKKYGIKAHPARFPHKLPEFFVKMLTDEGDLVVDIFGGSCTTGEVCDSLKRQWKCFELDKDYLAAASFRFIPKDMDDNSVKAIYDTIAKGEIIEHKFSSITIMEDVDTNISDKPKENALFKPEDF